MSITDLHKVDSLCIIYVGDKVIHEALMDEGKIDIGYTSPAIENFITFTAAIDYTKKIIFIIQTKIGLNKLKICLDIVKAKHDNLECWAIADHQEVSQSTILTGIGFDHVILTNVDSIENITDDVLAAIKDYALE